MTFLEWLGKKKVAVPAKSVEAVVQLKSEGSTVPFIARYRKEATLNLDEVQVQSLFDLIDTFAEFSKRKEFVLKEIEEQGKLSDELKKQIVECVEETILEDLYLPFKKKKKTKATIAKEAGLEPLSIELWDIAHGLLPKAARKLEDRAKDYVKADTPFTDAAAVCKGLSDIFIEKLGEMANLREVVRKEAFTAGSVLSKKGDKAKPASKYERYFEYTEKVSDLNRPEASHRYLAIRRGWTEEELSVQLGLQTEKIEQRFEEEVAPIAFRKNLESSEIDLLQKSARLALKGVVIPSIENEVHTALKATSETAAIHVFAENVKKLLMAAPFGNKAVLGVDPGIRTGCKLAVVNDRGAFVENAVVYPDMPGKTDEAKAIVLAFVAKNNIQAIAVGNGTASRETETFLKKTLEEVKVKIPVVMISEAGASVYSASAVAREEFPNLDLTVRGAITIARRLQNPIAELVKVDPKSLGVGQYQHDVNESKLEKTLASSVASCVHQVGVDVNVASHTLLSHISGIGPATAKNIVQFRAEHGLFKGKDELKKVPRFSEKMFELSAGFLRIREGSNPLDNTGVHPEKYPLLKSAAEKLNCKPEELLGEGAKKLLTDASLKSVFGEYSLKDIVDELQKPGRDPRSDFVLFQFREDIKEVKDLYPGLECPGIVTNVTNFGAFVDIGVHRDGLVHISELADRFVRDPHEVVKPGDVVKARVVSVDKEKGQIALSLRSEFVKSDKAASPSQSSVSKTNSQQSRAPSSPAKPAFGGGAFASLAQLKGALPSNQARAKK